MKKREERREGEKTKKKEILQPCCFALESL
jgi:hypothetical protein